MACWRRLSATVFLLLVITASAAAQVQHTGTLVGKLQDVQGGLLPGVTVELRSPALIRPESTATDTKGEYRFILLPIGVYKLTFSLQGFGTVMRDRIPVSADTTLAIDVVLQVGSVAESITVSGEAPVVDVRSATEAVHLDH